MINSGGRLMNNNECYITTLGEEWERIEDCNVHMNVKRRLQRTVIRGHEGDDLLDEGAESAVYTITGKMGMDQYKRILNIFRRDQPYFHDPFEDRQMKAIFASIDYDSKTGEFEFILLEDAEKEEIVS
ncbi:MAG: hypothetical protein CMB16_02835 [Euryarchaeota archaeon]|nr:hypothetical protein [Euryarchaeota archaeon]